MSKYETLITNYSPKEMVITFSGAYRPWSHLDISQGRRRVFLSHDALGRGDWVGVSYPMMHWAGERVHHGIGTPRNGLPS